MDRIKLLILLLLTCLTAVASTQAIPDVQWGASSVNETQVVRYSPNGDYVLTIGGNQLRLWRASNGVFVWVRNVSNLVDAQFSADSSVVLASTTTDIRKVSVASGLDTGAFSADAGAKGFLAVTPDGTGVAASANGSLLSFYNAATGALTTSFATTPGPSAPYLRFFQMTGQPLRIIVGTNAYNLDGTLWGAVRGAAGDTALPMHQNLTGRLFVVEGNAGVYTKLYMLQANVPNTVWKSFDLTGLNITPRAMSGDNNRSKTVFAIGGNLANNSGGFVALLDTATLAGGVKGNVITSTVGNAKSLAFSPTNEDFALVSQVGSSSTWKLEMFRLNATKTNATLLWSQFPYSVAPITQVAVGPAHASVTNTPVFVTGATTPPAGSQGVQVFNADSGARKRAMTESLFAGSRTRQLSVSTDGKFLAVVFNNSGNNLRVYNLIDGTSLAYAGHVTGAAFLNATDLVVDGPTKLRVGTGITSVSFAWGERGSIVDPVVSPDGTKLAMMDTISNDIVIFNTATGAAVRYTNTDTLADYGFETNNDFWTLVRNNTGASNSARINVYGVGATLTLKRSKTMTIPLLAGGGFTGWQATESLNGKWAAFVATRTNSTGAFVNTVRFWRWSDSAQFEYELPISGSVGGIAFNPASSMLLIGTSDGSTMSLHVPATPVSVTVNPTSIFGGQSTTATVTISEPGKPGGTTVAITTGPNLSAPATVTVAAGATSANFLVTSNGVAANTNGTVTATLNTKFASATVALKPPTPKNITFSPVTVEGGNTASATIALNGKAPAGGVVVNMAYTGALSGPATVTVPGNAASVVKVFNTSVVSAKTISLAKGTLNGVTVSGSAAVMPPKLLSLTTAADNVAGGASLMATATISQLAPAGGLAVSVVSDKSEATVPSTVMVAAGTNSKDFLISTVAVQHDVLVTLTGKTVEGTPVTKTFTVKAPEVTSVVLASNNLQSGQSTTGTVNISSPAPVGGLLIDMSSNDVSITVDDVTIPAGATSAGFTVNTTETTADVAGSVTATHDLSTASATLNLEGYSITSLTLLKTSVSGGSGTSGTVTISQAAPAGGYAVTLQSTDGAIVVNNLVIPAGATSKTFTVGSQPVLSDVNGSITAKHGPTQMSVNFQVKAPFITSATISPSTVTGGGTATVTVNFSSIVPNGFTFNAVSNNAAAQVSSPVSVPFKAKTVSFQVTTSSVGSQVIAKITVSRAGVSRVLTLTINP